MCDDGSMVCDESDCPTDGGDWDGKACTMPNLNFHVDNAGSVLYNSSEAIKAGKLLSELSSIGCMKTFTEKYANQSEYGAGNALFSIGSISGLKYYKSAVEKGANFN